jgi:hypothetical protein
MKTEYINEFIKTELSNLTHVKIDEYDCYFNKNNKIVYKIDTTFNTIWVRYYEFWSFLEKKNKYSDVQNLLYPFFQKNHKGLIIKPVNITWFTSISEIEKNFKDNIHATSSDEITYTVFDKFVNFFKKFFI